MPTFVDMTGWARTVRQLPQQLLGVALSSPIGRARTTAIEAPLLQKRQEAPRIAGKYGARRVRVFGSVARAEADAKDDVDFLVELETGQFGVDTDIIWLAVTNDVPALKPAILRLPARIGNQP